MLKASLSKIVIICLLGTANAGRMTQLKQFWKSVEQENQPPPAIRPQTNQRAGKSWAPPPNHHMPKSHPAPSGAPLSSISNGQQPSPPKPVLPLRQAAFINKPVLPLRQAAFINKPVLPLRQAASFNKPASPLRQAVPINKPASPLRNPASFNKPASPLRNAASFNKPASPLRQAVPINKHASVNPFLSIPKPVPILNANAKVHDGSAKIVEQDNSVLPTVPNRSQVNQILKSPRRQPSRRNVVTGPPQVFNTWSVQQDLTQTRAQASPKRAPIPVIDQNQTASSFLQEPPPQAVSPMTYQHEVMATADSPILGDSIKSFISNLNSNNTVKQAFDQKVARLEEQSSSSVPSNRIYDLVVLLSLLELAQLKIRDYGSTVVYPIYSEGLSSHTQAYFDAFGGLGVAMGDAINIEQNLTQKINQIFLESCGDDKQMKFINVLFQEPSVNYCALIAGKRLNVDQLPQCKNIKLLEATIQCQSTFLKQSDYPNKDSLVGDLKAVLLNAYQNSSETFLNIRDSCDSIQADDEELWKGSAEQRIDAFRQAVISKVSAYDHIEIYVDRENLLNSVKSEIDRIEMAKKSFSSTMLFVKFKGEQGVDSGALTRELFTLLSAKIFQQKHLFEMMGSKEKYVNIKPGKTSKQILDEYRFVGKVIGLALLNQGLFTEPISLVMLRQVLGLSETWADIREYDLEMFQNFYNYASKTKAEFEELKVRYEIFDDDLFGTEEGKVLVEHENLKKCLDTVVGSFIVENRFLQARAIKEGLSKIIPFRKLGILRPAELQKMLSGSDKIDLSNWQMYTKYIGVYEQEPNHPTIQMFWRFMAENLDYHLKILLYTTGYQRVPSGGFGHFKDGKRFSIRSSDNIKELPAANSCAFQLILPTYTDYDTLSTKLKMAVDNYEGFSLN